MDDDNLKIVCYTGGTCGDLISALIDSSGSKLNHIFKTVEIGRAHV